MHQGENPQRQHHDDRNLDPYNALQKVVRLDKKHTNFEYIDHQKNITFKVQYPCPQFDAPPGEHLLKSFWRHVTNYYFKQIEQSELQRLNYLQMLLQPTNQCDVKFLGDKEFWYTIDRLFQNGYKERYKKSLIDNMDCKNWLSSLYLTWEEMKRCENSSKKSKKQSGFDIKALNNIYSCVKKISLTQNLTKKQTQLQNEENQLNKYLPSDEDLYDEVQDQIRGLEEQLEEQCSQNHTLLQQLRQRVKRQISIQEVSIIKPQNQDEEPNEDSMYEPHTLEEEQERFFRTKRKLEKFEEVEITKKYIEYCIGNLQKRQIAESISKVSKLQKSKENNNTYQKGDYLFTVEFETGMNLKPIVMSEKQLEDLNRLREYNLFKFYNTSLKTPYSFICQNFYGFRSIYENRLKPCQLKDKNIVTLMKTSKADSSSSNQSRALRQMSKNFDVCHHCKLMYPEDYLVKCEYNSNRMGAPITPSSYFDPYVWQIIKHEQPKLSQRNMGKRRNCYTSYHKANDGCFKCQRKFCKFCLKQSYDVQLDKNGLCPFCQGNCFCTRCARHDMIIRLKSGEIKELQEESFVQKVAKWNQERALTASQGGRVVSRSQIRPQKKSQHSNPLKMTEKMRNIRFQLEDLRILCDLAKRREKQKQKLIETRCELFNKKVNLLSSSFDFKALNDSSINMIIEKEEQEERIRQKMKKKLKRMI